MRRTRGFARLSDRWQKEIAPLAEWAMFRRSARRVGARRWVEQAQWAASRYDALCEEGVALSMMRGGLRRRDVRAEEQRARREALRARAAYEEARYKLMDARFGRRYAFQEWAPAEGQEEPEELRAERMERKVTREGERPSRSGGVG